MCRLQGSEDPRMPPKKKILLIEDDPEDAELIVSLLNELDCDADVVHVRLLALGLRHLAAEDFDLAFLDLSLPDSWGMDTLRRLRNSFPGLPVVLMTGATMAAIDLEAEREGAVDCIRKQDLDASRLAEIVSSLGSR